MLTPCMMNDWQTIVEQCRLYNVVLGEGKSSDVFDICAYSGKTYKRWKVHAMLRPVSKLAKAGLKAGVLASHGPTSQQALIKQLKGQLHGSGTCKVFVDVHRVLLRIDEMISIIPSKLKKQLAPLKGCSAAVKAAVRMLCSGDQECLLPILAAMNLQRAWRQARYNPNFRICRRVILRHCQECDDGIASYSPGDAKIV